MRVNVHASINSNPQNNLSLHLQRAALLLLLAIPFAQQRAGLSQAPAGAPASTPAIAPAGAEHDEAKNTAQARAALDAMVKALGGDAWLNLKNEHTEGRIAAFYHGKPSGATSEYYDFHVWPNQDRIEFTKHRDVVQIYNGDQSAEITYKGRAPLPPDIVEDFIRRRNHSLETVVKVWLKNPGTILLYEGQHLAARHLAEQVTVISPENDSVTILMDIQSHLPLKRDYQWRDPLYKDKNTESEEYDDYHTVDGIPTPFIVTRFVNDDMVRQRFIFRAFYNESYPPDIFDIAATEKKIKK